MRHGTNLWAFPLTAKSKPQYVTRTSGGGKWTVAMALISLVLSWSELGRWWRGAEEHTFAVEKGVSHVLSINLDVVVRMRCADLHVNVQDASGDRIAAAERLTKDPTAWAHWVDGKGVHKLGRDAQGRVVTGEGYTDHDEGFGEEHVHDIVALGRRRAKWSRTPRLWGADPDSCRVYGSLEVNKVQGDFHFTASGHGYAGAHLDHNGRPCLSRHLSSAVHQLIQYSTPPQHSTSRTSSLSSPSAPSSHPSSTRSTGPSTSRPRASTSSSTSCPSCQQPTASGSQARTARAPSSRTSTP